MKSFSKNILALGVTSALSLSLSLSLFNYSHAATYKVIDKNPVENLGFTYGGKLNNQGNMAVSGANIYNFPVQFEYLDDDDFNNIAYLSLTQANFYYGLTFIEDLEALKAGNPTANDLAWSKLYLQERNGSVIHYQYQIVADTAAMINIGDGTDSTEICVFDTDFNGTSCSGTLTRSTYATVRGFNNSGTVFGTATASYLPIDGPANTDGEIQTHWVREHGQRGFFSPDFGETIFPVVPIETEYGGGISGINDVNDSGTAVGYSSYKVSALREEIILSETSVLGCANPDVLANVPYDICVQNLQSGMYYVQAFKATLSETGSNTELLGLLVEPHEDDLRAFTSQALAVNNSGAAVGYADGWDQTDVTEPTVTQSSTASYAVMFKEGKVLDFNQSHYFLPGNSSFSFSTANDINDSGLVVGFTHELPTVVKKFFYVDTNVSDSEMEIVIPTGFFNSSVSTAYAVNSSGVIVGEAQIESHNESSTNPRRTTGFMYDTASDTPEMIDLNTLLECNSPHNILEANDINDSGQISATAIVKSPAVDALGEEVIDKDGNPLMVDVARAVLLEPIDGGELEDCSLVEETVVRQGASFGGYYLLSLFTLLGLRRKKFI